MRVVPEAMTEAWLAEDKTGDRRPVLRATVQVVRLQHYPYDTASAPGGTFDHDRHRTGNFASILFAQTGWIAEIRNILEFEWSRSVNQDVAEATMTLKNSEAVPIGNTEVNADEFDLPGYFSPGRDGSTNPWGYGESPWSGVLAPDRMVCTYEGYGRDDSVYPAEDENLVQSGTWLIRSVDLNDAGEIVLHLQDIGRLLIDRIVFPPVVPKPEYPVTWSKIRTEQVQARDTTGGSWKRLTNRMGKAKSSNSAYIGKGLVDPPYANYVAPDGSVNGHHPRHVLDTNAANDAKTWWQSTGQTRYWDVVWWEIDFNSPQVISGVRLTQQGGPYRAYVSLHNGTKWLGTKRFDRSHMTEGIDNGFDVPWVRAEILDQGATAVDLSLPRVYKHITKLRVSFSRLIDTQVGNYPFRAGLKKVSIYTGKASELGFAKGPVFKSVGNIHDWSDPIRWAAAWGGFYWPTTGSGKAWVRQGWVDADVDVHFASPDPRLPKGRVWGDIMDAGTAPVADLTADLFDKQPLADIISYARDTLGFTFFVDEQGAIIWRMPNIWTIGNYLSPTTIGEHTRERSTDIIELSDDEALFNYSTTLDSKNIRERIFVANTTGKVGSVIRGYTPYKVNFDRVAGWSDQGFATRKECRVTAEMIAARQKFDYKRGHATIPGYPAIQIDDQIRIFERVTHETNYHYVESISSRMSFRDEDATWTYDLETHWLGTNPEGAWIIKSSELSNVTKSYLQTMGVI